MRRKGPLAEKRSLNPKHTMYRYFFILSVAFIALLSNQTEAQSNVLVLPTSASQDTTEQERLRATAVYLADQAALRGFSALASKEAVSLFEKRESAEPHALADANDSEKLAHNRSQILDQMVGGRSKRAYESSKDLLAEIEAAPEKLARQEVDAKHVLDICLFRVRAMIEIKGYDHDNPDNQLVVNEAMRCIRLVPDLTPSPRMHPPEVIQVYKHARRLEKENAGRMEVTSEPTQCPVFINGRRLGSTPFSKRVAAGLYRVQVECPGVKEGRARVHSINVDGKNALARLHVRRVFESAIHTSGGSIELRYSSIAMEERHRLDAARQVASAVGVSEVWLLSPVGVDEYRVDRMNFAKGDKVQASIYFRMVGADVAHQASHELFESMRASKSVDLREKDVRKVAAWVADEPKPVEEEVDAESADLSWLAYSTAGVGAAALIGGVAMEAAGGSIDNSPANIGLFVGSGGSLMLSLALPFILPEENGTPWYAWLSGVVGLGAIAGGVVAMLTHGKCKQFYESATKGNLCYDEANGQTEADAKYYETNAYGFAAFQLALPLLIVPITYWLRSDDGKPTTSANVRLLPEGGAALQIGGVW